MRQHYSEEDRAKLCEFAKAHGMNPDLLADRIERDTVNGTVTFYSLAIDDRGDLIHIDGGEACTRITMKQVAPWPLEDD